MIVTACKSCSILFSLDFQSILLDEIQLNANAIKSLQNIKQFHLFLYSVLNLET